MGFVLATIRSESFSACQNTTLPSASQGGVNGGGDTVETVEHGPTNQAPLMRKALPLLYADIILRPFLKFNNPITSGNVPSVALPGYIKFPAVRH